ncbi:MAG: nucleotidyltransferase family protein [Cellulosilyticaceae bacterium]
MKKKPVLVIMAAGMGSRYGGLKQIDAIGSYGEVIMDFSIYDALKAGFEKIVVIIKKQDEEAFKECVGNRIEKVVETVYAYQDINDVPAGCTLPDGREKPWGTGQAILACKDVVDENFAVINADDYYGPEAFQKMYSLLEKLEDDTKHRYGMVGYTLKNTLTEHGHVARGVCEAEKGVLKTICERTHIGYHEGQAQFLEGDVWTPVSEESIVSMNLWGFTPSIFAALEKDYKAFFENAVPKNPLKSEFFLPSVVDTLIQAEEASVEVLHSKDRWYGVTYKEDKPVVVAAIQALQEQGVYPKNLWEGK